MTGTAVGKTGGCGAILGSLASFVKHSDLGVSRVGLSFVAKCTSCVGGYERTGVRGLRGTKGHIPSGEVVSLCLNDLQRLFGRTRGRCGGCSGNLVLVPSSPFSGFGVPGRRTAQGETLSGTAVGGVCTLPCEGADGNVGKAYECSLTGSYFVLSFKLVNVGSISLCGIASCGSSGLACCEAGAGTHEGSGTGVIISIPPVLGPLVRGCESGSNGQIFGFCRCCTGSGNFGGTVGQNLGRVNSRLTVSSLRFCTTERS